MTYNDDILSFPLNKNIKIGLSTTLFSYDSSLDEAIECVWKRGVEQNKHLFNGTVANICSYTKEKIEIQFIEYKIFYAWFHDKYIKSHLQIYPFGVQAVVECDNCILIGKRSPYVALYPGLLETIPAGTVDIDAVTEDGVVDINSFVLRELFEEAGIKVTKPSFFSCKQLIHTQSTGLWSMVCLLQISAEDAQKAMKCTEECSSIQLISKKKLEKTIQSQVHLYIPYIQTIIDIASLTN